MRITPSTAAAPAPMSLATEFPATLHLELPAPGVVWANGNKSEGKPTNEWTFTSPAVKSGQSYTFDVTGAGKSMEKNTNTPGHSSWIAAAAVEST